MIDGVLEFPVINFLLNNDMDIPTPVLTIILALIIGCANLLGILICELIDWIIIVYWREDTRKRRLDLKANLEKLEVGETKLRVFELFSTEKMWNDYYFRPYRQEIITRLVLILGLALVGGYIYLRTILKRVENYLPLEQSNIHPIAALLIILFLIALLWISLRSKIYSKEKRAKRFPGDIVMFLFSVLFLLFIYDLLHDMIVLGLLEKIKWIFITLIFGSLILIVYLFCYLILKRWKSDSIDVEWGLWRKTENIIITFLTFGYVKRAEPIPLLKVPFFTTSTMYRVLRRNIGRSEEIVDENVFSYLDIYEQWVSLIIAYLECFFYSVKRESFPRPKLYMILISAVYTYKAIYKFFCEDALEFSEIIRKDEDQKKRTPEENIDEMSQVHSSSKVDVFDNIDLVFARTLDTAIDTIGSELEKENFERAEELYNVLGVLILTYFTDKKWDNSSNYQGLVQNVTIRYMIEHPRLAIQEIRSRDRLQQILNHKQKDRVNSKILIAIASNKNCDENLLEQLLDNKFKSEISTELLLTVIDHKNCSTDILLTITKSSSNMYETGEILNSIIKNKNATSDVLNYIASNLQVDNDILVLILHDNQAEKTNQETFSALSKRKHQSTEILKMILFHKREELVNIQILTSIIENDACSSDILETIIRKHSLTPTLLKKIVRKNIFNKINTESLKILTSGMGSLYVRYEVPDVVVDKILHHDGTNNSVIRPLLISYILTETQEEKCYTTKNHFSLVKGWKSILVTGTRHPQIFFKQLLIDQLTGTILSGIGENEWSSRGVLEKVLAHPEANSHCCRTVAQNKNADEGILKEVLNHEKVEGHGLRNIIENSNCTLPLMKNVFRHKEINSYVLRAMAWSTISTTEILQKVVDALKETDYGYPNIDAECLRIISKREECTTQMRKDIEEWTNRK